MKSFSSQGWEKRAAAAADRKQMNPVIQSSAFILLSFRNKTLKVCLLCPITLDLPHPLWAILTFQVTEGTPCFQMSPKILPLELNIYGPLLNFLRFMNAVLNYFNLKVHLFSLRAPVNSCTSWMRLMFCVKGKISCLLSTIQCFQCLHQMLPSSNLWNNWKWSACSLKSSHYAEVSGTDSFTSWMPFTLSSSAES